MLLVIVMTMEFTQTTIKAAVTGETYISDIRIGSDSSSDAAGIQRAKDSLTNLGYTVIEGNLNDGTGNGCAFVGYKTTTNKDEAITDLKMMNMDGGYELNNYYSLFSQYKSSINDQAKGLGVAIDEFKSNLAKNSKGAKWAYEKLNYLVVSTAGDMPLGDYLLSSDRTTSDYYDIILKCDPTILTYILSQVTVAVADCGSDTWLQRFGNLNASEMRFSDTDYYDRAMMIYPTVKNFATDCVNAFLALDTDMSGMTDEEKTANAQLVTAGNTLNEYEYDGTGIGDILANTALFASDLYPLVYVLTPGQLSMLSMTGMQMLIAGLMNLSDGADEAYASAEAEIADQIQYVKGIDLWTNIVQNVMQDKEIAVTSAAARKMAAQDNIDALAKTDKNMHYADTALKIIQVALPLGLLMMQLSWKFIAASYGVSFALSSVVSSLGTAFCAGMGGVIAGTIFSVGAIVFVVAIAALIAVAIYYIYRAWKSDNVTLSSIPLDMYDYAEVYDTESGGGTKDVYIAYVAALDQNGSAADLNLGKGKKWNALYISYDENAGSPFSPPHRARI